MRERPARFRRQPAFRCRGVDSPPPSRGAVLDLGCGRGLFTEYLISKGYDAYGLDAAPDAVCFAELCNPGRFFVCDIASNPLPDALRRVPVRTVVALDLLASFPDPRRLTAFVRAALEAGGGTFVFSVPYYGYLKNLLVSLAGGWDARWNPIPAEGPLKFWSRRTLTRLTAEAGFRCVLFRGAGGPPCLWRRLICRAEL